MANNTATSADGGAVANYGLLNVSKSTFSNNSASGTAVLAASGGAIYNQGGTATIETSTFTGNKVIGTFSSGGAVAVNGGRVTFNGGALRQNEARDGGALLIGSGSVATLTGVTLENNKGGYGGAIENSGTLTVTDSVIANNQATVGDGGGVWNLSGTANLINVTISGNQAQTTGGGLSSYGNTVVIWKSTISGNTAAGNGGGLYLTGLSQLLNVTLSANKVTGAGSSGGGGLFNGGSAALIFVTVANNSAPVFGAGLYNDSMNGATLVMENSLLANNTTGGGSANCDGTISSSGHNFATDTKCALSQTGDQQNVALPLGALADNGGPTLTHMPQPGNPAIDAIPLANCPVAYRFDQRGVERPYNVKCDSGAVEVNIVNVYLPLVMR